MSECRVVKSHDGCISDLEVKNPLFKGTYEECVAELRGFDDRAWNMLKAKGLEVDIISMESGRALSWCL